MSLIDEVNAEQWFEWTDYLGDLFCIGLDIQDYLDNVDAYHKKVLDKNDTTKEEINNIFIAVNLVDSSYESIFGKCCDSVREQCEYIKHLSDCIDPSQSNFNVGTIIKNMSSAEKKLMMSKVELYADKLRNGEGDGSYDYEYLREIMSENPEKISPEMYLALIKVFNEMDIKSKEKFIENSYIVGNFYPNKEGSGKYEYKISDVFSQMTAVCGQLADGMAYSYDNDKIDKFLSDYCILNSIVHQANSVYVMGTKFMWMENKIPVDITIKKDNASGNMLYDYVIDFNGSKEPYNVIGMSELHNITINTYQMRNGTSIDSIFDKYVIDLTDSLRVDVDMEKAKTIAGGVKDVFFSFIEIEPVVSAALAAGDTVSDLTFVTIEGNATNNTIDKAQSLLKDANTYNALAMKATFSFRDDGTYAISSFIIDKNDLNNRLKAWQNNKNIAVDYTADDVVDKLKTGRLNELNKIEDFVNWYSTENGGDYSWGKLEK